MDLKSLYQKYRQIFWYLFFGVCTMILNTACYTVLYEHLGVPNVPATVAAWLAAVIVAFITNKLIVFESRERAGKGLFELVSFFSCRVATGLLDVLIMWIAVDILAGNSTLWKFVSNVIITVLNYVVSKCFIFKKRNEEEPL